MSTIDNIELLLIPQRYEFSSKSQQIPSPSPRLAVVADTTKVRIFKQITTYFCLLLLQTLLLLIPQRYEFSSKSQRSQSDWQVWLGCCWYHKGTNFQANHNSGGMRLIQIQLLLIPQRYEFSSKSQQARNPLAIPLRCCWYHKGTNFQANHNM